MAAALRSARRRAEPDPRQLSIPLSTPHAHCELLYTQQLSDIVAWLPRRKDQGKKTWHVLAPHQVADQLSRWLDEPDVYASPNEFRGWRRLKLLDGLNALYLDFDSHEHVLSQGEIHAWAERTLRKVERLGWPQPTAVIYSGRGFHLYWRHHRLPHYMLSWWQSTIRYMRTELGADPNSADSCRVLRVIGTAHTKVADFQVHGERIADGIYQFHDLYQRIMKPPAATAGEDPQLVLRAANESILLPPERAIAAPAPAVVRDITAGRLRRDAQRETKPRDRAPEPWRFTGVLTYWQNVHADVWTLAESVSDTRGHVPDGHRTLLLELLCASLAWFTQSEALDDEVLACGRVLMPSFTDERILSATQTLRQRAQSAAAGETITWQGKQVDPRYRYSRARLLEKLGDRITADLVPQLQAIVPDDVAAERKQARDSARWRDSYTGEGYRASNAGRLFQARQLAADGLSQRLIATQLGVSQKTVSKWLSARASEASGEGDT